MLNKQIEFKKNDLVKVIGSNVVGKIKNWVYNDHEDMFSYLVEFKYGAKVLRENEIRKVNELVILNGNIGSGKTTFCRKKENRKYCVVSRDDLRYSIGAGKYIFDLELEPIIIKTAHFFVEQLLKKGRDVILDETNISKEYRKQYISLAKEYGYKITVIKTKKISKEESINRRLKDNHGDNTKEIWSLVWERLNNMYEEPTLEEGIDEIIQL